MDQRSRAAASIAQPLEAEVLVDGVWRPGAVLGWQHDEAGRCRAQVRIDLPAAGRERLVELAAVRLPEPPAASVPVPVPVLQAAPAATVVMSRTELRELLSAGLPARSTGRRRRHASDLTAELPAVSCAEVADGPGRHRAPAPAGGRHRAGDDAVAVPARDLLTRPIRLDDVAAWPWETSSAIAG